MFERLLPSPLPHEHVVFYLRRHWFTFATQVAVYLVLFAAPSLIGLALDTYLPQVQDRLWNGGLTEIAVTLVLSLYYLAVWSFFWSAWVDYYLDVWLVTSERIVGLEQRGLFNRTVAELRLSRVQDIKSVTTGIWRTFLHFGEITVQTAGEEENFVFHDIPRPYEISERIMRLADDWRHSSHESP